MSLVCIRKIISVGASSRSPCVGDDFDHLTVHSVACTLKEDGCAMGYGSLRFGSLHEVIKIVHEGCFVQGNGCLKLGKKMHKVCLE